RFALKPFTLEALQKRGLLFFARAFDQYEKLFAQLRFLFGQLRQLLQRVLILLLYVGPQRFQGGIIRRGDGALLIQGGVVVIRQQRKRINRQKQLACFLVIDVEDLNIDEFIRIKLILTQMTVDQFQASVRQFISQDGARETNFAEQSLQRFALLFGVKSWI